MNSIDDRWRSLAPRERHLVVAALVLALVVAGVYFLGPLLGAGTAAQERRDRALEDSAWLRAQAVAGRLSASGCGGGDEAPVDLAARHGVTLAGEEVLPGGDFLLILEARDGNGALAFIRDLDCRGHGLAALSLDRVGSGGAVRGEARFHRPVTKPS